MRLLRQRRKPDVASLHMKTDQQIHSIIIHHFDIEPNVRDSAMNKSRDSGGQLGRES